MNLKPYETRILSYLLQIASEEFSNHGCNDLDMTDPYLNLTDGERREFVLKMATYNGDEGEIEYVKNADTPKYTNDGYAMSHFSELFAGKEIPEVQAETESDRVARLKSQVDRLTGELDASRDRLNSVRNKILRMANEL